MAVSWTHQPGDTGGGGGGEQRVGEGVNTPAWLETGSMSSRAPEDDPQKAQDDDLGGRGLSGRTRGRMVLLQRFIWHIESSLEPAAGRAVRVPWGRLSTFPHIYVEDLLGSGENGAEDVGNIKYLALPFNMCLKGPMLY